MLKYFSFETLIMKRMCPECGSTKIEFSMAEVICRRCGLVISDNILISG